MANPLKSASRLPRRKNSACLTYAVRVQFSAYETNPSLFMELLQSRGGGKVLCLLGLWILICFCPTGQAVVIVTGDGSGNTSAPSDDPGWNYVGRVGGGSGVYLGKYGPTNNLSYWVLTASHVSLRNIWTGDSHSFHLGDTSYNIVEDSKTTIRSSGSFTDLALFQIESAPSWPHLAISSNAPAVGSSITAIGYGLDRETDLKGWASNGGEVALDSTNAVKMGWILKSSRTKRWGNNKIDKYGNYLLHGQYNRMMDSVFDAPGSTNIVEHEARVAAGDSGGGVFHKSGNRWELAGIISGVQGVPIGSGIFSSSSPAVFGYDEFGTPNGASLAIDLAFYQNEIHAIIPEPKEVGVVMGVFALAFVAILRFRRRQQLASRH